MIMNKKLTAVIAAFVAAALLACVFIFGFSRGVNAGYSYVYTVELNDDFDKAKVEDAIKQSGASDYIIQQEKVYNSNKKQFVDGTNIVVSFNAASEEDAKAIFEKTEQLLGESYFLKYEGNYAGVSSLLNKQLVLRCWPVLIVLAVLVAYAIFRFGLKTGLALLAGVTFDLAATLGIVSVTRIKVTQYMPAALLLTCAMAALIVFVTGYAIKENLKRISGKENAVAVALKQNVTVTLVVSAMAAAACAVMMILGNSLVRGFALSALVGTIVNAAYALAVLPAFFQAGKAK